jgi:hypothetical protein
MTIKKVISFLTIIILSLFIFFGCNTVKEDSEIIIEEPEISKPDDDVNDEEDIINLYESNDEVNLAAKNSKEYIINVISDRNAYLSLEINTEVNLLGEIFYHSVGGTEKNSETFFVEANTQTFNQYLDVYRNKNIYAKTIDKIILTNISDNNGNVCLKKAIISDNSVEDYYVYALYNYLYFQNEYIKLGVDLSMGGGIFYLERLNNNITQTIDEQGYARIEQGETDNEVLFKNVNLLNYHDAGRLIQQSYYGEIYEDSTYNGSTWAYNPVQGGDKTGKRSQIIDVKLMEDCLYVKCKPMDWALSGVTINCYMENWYYLEGDTVRVVNKYIDFTGVDHLRIADQEVPAFYAAYSLNKFVYENDTGLIEKENLPFWSDNGQKDTRFSDSTKNWCAWVNEENFGIGLYVPNVTTLLAGRYMGANPSFEEAKKFTSKASTLGQTCYVAPLVRFKVPTYDSFSYEYYIMVDNINTMKNKFNELSEHKSNNNYFIN